MSCVITPTVKVNNEEKESKLFKDLLSYIGNRESAQIIWALSQIPEITENLSLERDENNEPTLESLDKALDIKALLNGDISLMGEKISLGATDKKGKHIVYEKPELIIDKVIDFNDSNPKLVADVSRKEDGYIITVENKTTDNIERPSKLVFHNSLNNKLLGIMRSLGFDVNTNSRMTYDGIFNPLNATVTSEGLRTIIQIAKGKRGEDSFPEEFSHFIIEGLSNNSLVSRLLNSLQSPEVIREILGDSYDRYKELYNNDYYMLQKEAAAQLLRNHIVKGGNSNKVNRESFLSRIWNFVKNIFSNIEEKSINDAIEEANKEASKIASMIDDGSIIPLIDKKAVLGGRTMYSVGNKVNKLEDLANKALEVASRRLKILTLKSRSGIYNEEDVENIKNLQDLIGKKKYAKSCLAFLSDSLTQIEQLDKQFQKLQTTDIREDSDLSKIKWASSLLRNIKDFAEGYAPIIQEMINIKSMQSRKEADLTEEDADIISKRALEVFGIVSNINSQYKSLRYNTVYNFLKLYWGEDKTVEIGKNKGKQFTLAMIMEMADKDINGIDRWISSMGDSSDAMLSLIDKAVKIAQSNRDSMLIKAQNALRNAQKKLQDAGHTSEFMYERDKKGNLTGRIISDRDFNKFYEERQKYKDKLKKEGIKGFKLKTKLDKWENDNTESVVLNEEIGRIEKLPRKDLYSSNALNSLDSAQKEYYDTMMQVKVLTDDLLPIRYTNTYRAVQIRNDITEAITNNLSDPKTTTKQILDIIKDRFIRRSDDTEFGEDSNSVMFTTFSGKPIDRLPIYYTTKLEDMSRLSTDFTSSMLAYVGMAYNYNELNKIIDALELTKDFVMDRNVAQYSGDRGLIESFKILSKEFKKPYTLTGSQSNIGDKLDDYFQSVIYGRSKKDQGTIGNTNLDTAKVLDTLKSYTGIMGLGLNAFSAISNITNGNMQAFIESVGMEYFNLKNLAVAEKNYWWELGAYIGELNAIRKTSKLSLLIDKFDALEEFYSNLRKTGYYKGPLSRIIGSSNLFFLNHIGEHYLHTRNMLAILDNYKVKDNSGKEISIYEALEVFKEPDGKGGFESTLRIKEGITKLDGSSITEKDLIELKLKIGKINQALNGAFNDSDKGAFHRNAYGRLAMQFRQWMPAHYSRRFGKARYDATLDQWREGYYQTLIRFGWDVIKDISRAKFELGTHYNELSSHEKSNLMKAFSEMGIFAMLSILLPLLGPPEDRKGIWHERMIMYSLYRLKLETGASMPFNTDFLTNIWTLLQSPAAALKQLDNLTALFQFYNITKEIESGRYKGWNEYAKTVYLSIPVAGQINKVIDITDESYMFTIFNR